MKCRRKHSHKSRTCTQTMNTGEYKWDLIKSYKKKTTSRDTIPGWRPTAVFKEHWSFVVLNKHENKSHACLRPPGCYLCLWIELHMHRQQVHKSGVLVSTDRGVRKAFLYQRHRQTWGGTSGRDSNFPTARGCICFVPFEQVFPTAKAAQSRSGCSP